MGFSRLTDTLTAKFKLYKNGWNWYRPCHFLLVTALIENPFLLVNLKKLNSSHYFEKTVTIGIRRWNNHSLTYVARPFLKVPAYQTLLWWADAFGRNCDTVKIFMIQIVSYIAPVLYLKVFTLRQKVLRTIRKKSSSCY